MTDTSKPTLLQRLKKASVNPLIMTAIAGVSYFAGLKKSNNNSDPLASIREQIGEINHVSMAGDKGNFDYKIEHYSLNDKETGEIGRLSLTKGSYEMKMAYDYGTNDGILKDSNGVSSYVKDGQWVQGSLTAEQEAYLDGKSNNSQAIRSFTREFDKKTDGDSKNSASDQTIAKHMNKMKADAKSM